MDKILIILIIALNAKNLIFCSEINLWLRGFSEILCFIVGYLYLTLKLNKKFVFRKYLILLLYILFLYLSIINSNHKLYVFLQVMSFVGVIVFFIAYSNWVQKCERDTTVFFKTTFLCYLFICLAGLFVAKFYPTIGYRWVGDVRRFVGIFGKPGILSVSAGLLCGIALFGYHNNYLKLFAFTIGLCCILLSLSRTYWVAFLFAILSTYIRYYRLNFKMIVCLSYVLILIILSTFVLNFERTKIIVWDLLRAESLKTLSGRVDIWKFAINRCKDNIFGLGFTAGGDILANMKTNAFPKLADHYAYRLKLHSGFIQSLCDIGLIGSIFYVLIIISAFILLFMKDKQRQLRLEFFCLVFLTVTNFAETTILSVATFHSIVFWFIYIYLLELEYSQSKGV